MTIEPPNEGPHACVLKLEPGTYDIRLPEKWTGQALRVFRGDSPATIDRSRPVLEIRSATGCRVSGLDPDRHHFFALEVGGQSGVICAARRVDLDGVPNFRDLGGYQTDSGRRIQWGRVFRSSHLADLSSRDQMMLKRLGIATVCDFRSAAEIEAQPNRLNGSWRPSYLKLPIVHGSFDPVEALALIQQNDLSWLSMDFMVDMYLKKIEHFADVWKVCFDHLAHERHLPLAFHCTAGKDRTGVCAALILLSLGVSEDVVLDDHELSNTCNAAVQLRIRKTVSQWGVDPQQLEPYLTAPKPAMQAVIDHLNTTYGSAKSYLLNKAKVAPQTLERMRTLLLHP